MAFLKKLRFEQHGKAQTVEEKYYVALWLTLSLPLVTFGDSFTYPFLPTPSVTYVWPIAQNYVNTIIKPKQINKLIINKSVK